MNALSKPRIIWLSQWLGWCCAHWEPFGGGRKSVDQHGIGKTPREAFDAWAKANRKPSWWRR